MINRWYNDKLIPIKKVLQDEGVITLFDILTKVPNPKPSEHFKQILQGSYWAGPAKLEISLFKELGLTQWHCLKFNQGDYKLRHDNNTIQGPLAILNLNDWDDSWGGYIVVINQHNQEIPIISQKNSLTIITNAKDFYVKYINHKAKRSKKIIISGW